jgi:8-oxo-dGTP diphosphatase
VPGGALDSHEDVVEAALREAEEEAGADPGAIRVLGQVLGLDHGDWSYTYVIAVADPNLTVQVRTAESTELRWVSLGQVRALGLHPQLRSAWPLLDASIRRHVPG